MVTNPAPDASEAPVQCDGCYVFLRPDEARDPNTLEYYLHLHIKPEEVVDELTVPALHEYLVRVLRERWPDQLLLKHGVDHVRHTLRQATALHGMAFKRGGIDNPGAFFRWLLKQPPLMNDPKENPFDD